jgi:hypothetical protein
MGQVSSTAAAITSGNQTKNRLVAASMIATQSIPVLAAVLALKLRWIMR